MPSKSYSIFSNNLDTVKRLEESYDIIRKNRSSKGKGAFDHLTRSAILFLASAFEVYIEDFTNECCMKNIIMARDAVNLPHGVRSSLNTYTKKEKSSFSPINLCDEGWRVVYETMVSEATGKLNTPKVANIKALFSQYIGIDGEKIGAIEHIDRLDDFVSFRGEITHRVKANKYVNIQDVKVNVELIENLVIDIDKMGLDFLREQYPTGRSPWNSTYN